MEPSYEKKTNVVFIMAGVMLCIFISSLDNTITGTAMPKIISEFNGIELYSMPFTIYMLCSIIAIPVLGKISDSYGRKLTFVIGIVTFIVASIMCGLSTSMIQLIIFRGLQGIGGGTLIANSFIVVADLFPPVERAKYMGMVVAAFGLSSLLGPVIGGIVTDSFGWRWIFLINLPLGLAALFIVAASLSCNVKSCEKKHLDISGIAAFVSALVPMLLYLSWAGKYFGWLSVRAIVILTLSIVMLIIFVRIEAKAKDPLIPMSAFKNPILRVSMSCVFLINIVSFGTIMLVPLFLQNVKGVSSTTSGAYITPMILSLLITSAVTGIIITKTGCYKMLSVLACGIIFIGMLLLVEINSDTSIFQIVIRMLILGIGIGISLPVFDLASQNAFPHNQVGFITSIIQFARNMGGVIGSAVLGAILTSSASEGLPMAIHYAFIALFFAAVLILLAVIFFKEIPLRKSNQYLIHDNIIEEQSKV